MNTCRHTHTLIGFAYAEQTSHEQLFQQTEIRGVIKQETLQTRTPLVTHTSHIHSNTHTPAILPCINGITSKVGTVVGGASHLSTSACAWCVCVCARLNMCKTQSVRIMESTALHKRVKVGSVVGGASHLSASACTQSQHESVKIRGGMHKRVNSDSVVSGASHSSASACAKHDTQNWMEKQIMLRGFCVHFCVSFTPDRLPSHSRVSRDSTHTPAAYIHT